MSALMRPRSPETLVEVNVSGHAVRLLVRGPGPVTTLVLSPKETLQLMAMLDDAHRVATANDKRS